MGWLKKDGRLTDLGCWFMVPMVVLFVACAWIVLWVHAIVSRATKGGFMRRLLPMIAAGLLWSATAVADPIRAGHLSWTGPDTSAAIQLQADGFTFTGQAVPTQGVFGPLGCVFGPCQQGDTLTLEARWTGMDLPGTVETETARYDALGSPTGTVALDAHWLGTLTARPGTVTAPFTFEGLFLNETGGRELFGQGLATASFTEDGGALALRSVEYVFGSEAVANPEPASLLLMATGIAGCWRKRGVTA